jgi:UDP-N-acetyl-2-amino-2-deoxyglucuronate dehydrogenase
VTRAVGLLGGGNISDTHARAAASIPGLAITAVCGTNEGRVNALAARYGAAPYLDVHAFLGHRPLDIVAIGSPSGVHGEQVAAAAAHGLHVLVEKPIEITTERVDRLTEHVDRAGITLGVFFQDRSTPDLMAVAEEIAGGVLGRLTLAEARVKWYRPAEYYRESRWRGTWALDGGGALMNQGIHTVDLLLWWLGDVKRVYARTATALHAIEVEDTAVAVLEFASGALGLLEATTAAYPGYDRHVAITGTHGTIVIERDRVRSRDILGEARPDVPARATTARASKAGPAAGVSASSPVVADASAHRRVFEDFLKALEAGGQPRVDAREARRSVALVEAVYESARRGQAVDLV